jgi:hypothetical protein
MSRIYDDHRGSSYVNLRKKWEPWYNGKFNANRDDKKWIESRKSAFSEFI